MWSIGSATSAEYVLGGEVGRPVRGVDSPKDDTDAVDTYALSWGGAQRTPFGAELLDSVSMAPDGQALAYSTDDPTVTLLRLGTTDRSTVWSFDDGWTH
jgi:hypothetical protein